MGKQKTVKPDTTTRSACIALPTYNEAPNIEKLIQEIEKVTKKLRGWKIDLLIIDDNSPDGTAGIVKKLQKKYRNLHLITGQKKGLGAAYTRGFKHILNTMKCDYIFQMDADFQHNPRYIPQFLKKTAEGYDFIIGSRYIAGGDYPNWSFKRKLYSWGANFIARKIAGIYDIEDCTSGFRCISAKFLKSFDLGTLRANGYAFQMSLLHAATKKHLKITQIPILFPNRTRGESKLGRHDIKEFFINAIKLRFKKY
ncbi:MAG TPA: polyprenol monophosphomannose synthase [Candidatus Gracilibacteria bacterium]|nr:polyprenol monophosphomannose synthase [Candidatus Gracilibacteria bacterium]